MKTAYIIGCDYALTCRDPTPAYNLYFLQISDGNMKIWRYETERDNIISPFNLVREGATAHQTVLTESLSAEITARIISAEKQYWN